jgi:hypothetical protein
MKYLFVDSERHDPIDNYGKHGVVTMADVAYAIQASRKMGKIWLEERLPSWRWAARAASLPGALAVLELGYLLDVPSGPAFISRLSWKAPSASGGKQAQRVALEPKAKCAISTLHRGGS